MDFHDISPNPLETALILIDSTRITIDVANITNTKRSC